MKTKSTGQLCLLDDGSYRGYWKGFTVIVPFAMEEVVFDVAELVPEKLEVIILIKNGIAFVETLGD